MVSGAVVHGALLREVVLKALLPGANGWEVYKLVSVKGKAMNIAWMLCLSIWTSAESGKMERLGGNPPRDGCEQRSSRGIHSRSCLLRRGFCYTRAIVLFLPSRALHNMEHTLA